MKTRKQRPSMVRNVDRLIAEENRRFLADPKAIADARAEGEMYRLRLEAEGILPKLADL
jgi:hypothetical protein